MTTRNIDARLFVDWDFDGTFTDESANLISASGEFRLIPFGGSIFANQGIVSTCQLRLHNPVEADSGRRYSSRDSRSDLWNQINSGGTYHVPLYLECSIDDGANYYRVFTGVMKVPTETGASMQGVGEIQIDCRSNEEKLLNVRLSTPQATFKSNHDSGVTESDLMGQWLVQAGLTASDYVLDTGMFDIPFGWLENESVIEACWSLAAACGGRFYCRPDDGKFVYENAAHWCHSPHDTSSPVLYDKDDYAQPRLRWSDNEMYNRVTVQPTPYEIDQSQTLWESTQTWDLPASGTVDVEAVFSSPAYEITSVTYHATTPGGRDETSNVTIARTDFAQHMEMTFTNTIATDLYVVKITIEGKPISSLPSAIVESTSALTYWNNRAGRTRNVSGNKFIQGRRHAEYVANLLLGWHEKARLFFVFDGVPGDAQRRLGDRINLDDPDMMNSSDDAFITSIGWSYGGNKFSITGMESVAADTFYPNYSTATTMYYFVLGTSKMQPSVASADFGYAFY
jgi:hypothetical protein